ncbi:MAG TPA: hypothetical protein VFD36_14870 [Kofleriaceae bacterium]|nr:hypothetical protein [Kofleriaceae bacterium]
MVLVEDMVSRRHAKISSITPDIGRPWVAWRCCAPASRRRRASASLWLATWPSTATTLMIDVPTRMRSPSCSSARPAIFSPLTNVPFVEPMSWM